MTSPSTTPGPGGTPPTAPRARTGAAGTGDSPCAPVCITRAAIASCVTRSQLAVLFACQMPLKSGLPFAWRLTCGDGAGGRAAADRGVDTCPAITPYEMTLIATMMPTARAETPSRVRMVPPSLRKRGKSLLVLASSTGRVVLRRRVGTLAFRKRLLRSARVQQHAEQSVVALVAAALEHERRLLVGPIELLHRRPRARPRGWILRGEFHLQRVGVDTPEALDQ